MATLAAVFAPPPANGSTTGTAIGGGTNGTVQTRGGTFDQTSSSVINAGGCTVANGMDSTATGLCASSGSVAGINGATETKEATGATAYGAYANAADDNTTAIGFRATAQHMGSVAIGYQAQAIADPTTAIGYKTLASGMDAVAVGANAQATADYAVSVGPDAKATARNSVALGRMSIADEANTVSVGSVGNERRITNVAAGVNPNDAVNVSQLNVAHDRINEVSNRVNSVARAAYSGTAMSLALAGNYMPTLGPGEKGLGAGVGNFRGQTALGINFKAVTRSGFTWGGGLATTGQEVGVNLGIGYKW